jgi:hypothetical protein
MAETFKNLVFNLEDETEHSIPFVTAAGTQTQLELDSAGDLAFTDASGTTSDSIDVSASDILVITDETGSSNNLTVVNPLLYTCPSNTQTVIVAAQVANVVDTNGDVNLRLDKSSGKKVFLVKDYTVAADTKDNLVEGKLFLETGDKLNAFTGALEGSYIDLTLSLLEIT